MTPALLPLLFVPSYLEAADPPRPNVVLLVADDLGYGELRGFGTPGPVGDFVPTPHLDAVLDAGVRLTAGYVTASYCSPSRAGLLTGRVQTRFGHELNPVGAHNEHPAAGLPASEKTFADRLRSAGYATGLVGKWHLGGAAAAHPLRRGFDEFFGFLHEGHFYVPPPYEGVVSVLRRRSVPGGGPWWRSPDGTPVLGDYAPIDEPPYDANNPLLRGGQPVVEDEYLTDAFAREAVDFVARHAPAARGDGGTARRPFALTVSFSAVHSPMQATAAKAEEFADAGDPRRRVFAGMLSSMDDAVGRVVAAMEAEGLTRDTLVLFVSDNGGPTAELTSSNHPLRGGKGSVYDGGLRVPMGLAWPAALPSGKNYAAPVLACDLTATALAAAGTALPKNGDGVDLAPHLTGNLDTPPHPVLYWRMGAKAALRSGNLKVVRDARGRTPGGWELYDLAADPAESRDLAADRPADLARLVAEWEARNAAMVEPRWRP